MVDRLGANRKVHRQPADEARPTEQREVFLGDHRTVGDIDEGPVPQPVARHQGADARKHRIVGPLVGRVAVQRGAEDRHPPLHAQQLGHELLQLGLVVLGMAEGDQRPLRRGVGHAGPVLAPDAGAGGVVAYGTHIKAEGPRRGDAQLGDDPRRAGLEDRIQAPGEVGVAEQVRRYVASQQEAAVLVLPELLDPIQRRAAAEHVEHHRLDGKARRKLHGGGHHAVHDTPHIEDPAVGCRYRQVGVGEERCIGERVLVHGGSSLGGKGIDGLPNPTV